MQPLDQSLMCFLHLALRNSYPQFEIMAQLGGDERAPNVSDSMRRRIGTLLDSGSVPTLRGNLLRLGTIVLSRADGRNAPATREVELQMRRRNMPMAGVFSTYGPAAPVRKGRGTYATDNAGVERMITRRIGNENRVTQAGRRFYRQPYTQWIVHIPTGDSDVQPAVAFSKTVLT